MRKNKIVKYWQQNPTTYGIASWLVELYNYPASNSTGTLFFLSPV